MSYIKQYHKFFMWSNLISGMPCELRAIAFSAQGDRQGVVFLTPASFQSVDAQELTELPKHCETFCCL